MNRPHASPRRRYRLCANQRRRHDLLIRAERAPVIKPASSTASTAAG